MKAVPGQALKLIEAKLLLELLMRLFTNPSGLDGTGERLEAGVCWQVRCVVFLLAGRTTLTDQPDLLISWHGLHATFGHTVFVAISDPDARCGEPAGETAFSAPLPTELTPFFTFQHPFSGNSHAIRQVIFAAAPTPGLGKDQSDIDQIDVLAPRQTDCPGEATCAQSMAERPARSLTRVGQYAAEADACSSHSIDLRDGDVRLAQGDPPIIRHTGTCHAVSIARPSLG